MTPVPARPGLLHPVDTALAALLLALCGWLYYVTTTFEEVSDLFAQDVPPAFFPRLLLWLIALLSLLLPFERRLFGNGPQLDKGRARPVGAATLLTAALLALLVAATPWLGSYLALVGVCLLLPPLWGERRWRLIVPYALIFPTLIMLLFAKVLKVYFEPGVFGLGFR